MITAWNLFKLPALGAFLLIIPIVGWIMYLMLVWYWYDNRKEEIHAFFRGYEHKQNEYSKDQLFFGV